MLDNRVFLRFILVGAINTLFGYSLFALFLYAGFYYPIAIFLATILGVLFNYKTMGRLVFFHQGKSRLVPFVFVYIMVYSLNVYGLWQLEVFGLENKYIAGALLMIPLALVSFLLNKSVVFKE